MKNRFILIKIGEFLNIMKKIKNIFIFILVVTFMLASFVSVFADDAETEEEAIEEASEGDILESTSGDEESSECVFIEDYIIEDFIINPERVLDYSKMYHLATVVLHECSRVKWYLLKEDGSLFNGGAENEHHGSTYEIMWNALDVNGTHPSGTWNNPVTLRLSLVIIATGINGDEEYATGWFYYSWYDNEKAPVNQTVTPSTTPSNNNSQTSSHKSDLPHTGL